MASVAVAHGTNTNDILPPESETTMKLLQDFPTPWSVVKGTPRDANGQIVSTDAILNSVPDLCQLVNSWQQMREALEDIAQDCVDVSHVDGVLEGERRAWKAVAAKAKHALALTEPGEA